MLAELKRGGVPRYIGAQDIRIEGDTRAEVLCFSHRGRIRRLACETVFLHHGVVPNTQAARALGVAHHWSTQQQCFVPTLDCWGRSDVPGVFVAGDGAGIGGAKAAALSGRLAALAIACDAARLTPDERDRRARPLRSARAREQAPRPFLDTAYPPCAQALSPRDETLVCRCEEVTAEHGPRSCPRWMPRPQSDQDLWPRRHGAMPRALLRIDSHRPSGRGHWADAGPDRLLSHSPATEARDPG